jgi:hypothetical protein
LLEPFGETPGVTGFRGSPEDWLEITGGDFDDRLSLDAAGALRYVRRVEGSLRRLALAGATRLEQGGRLLLELDAPVPVQVDLAAGRVEIFLGGPFTGQMRVLAPGVQAVTVNGAAAEFLQDGDYCAIAAKTGTEVN